MRPAVNGRERRVGDLVTTPREIGPRSQRIVDEERRHIAPGLQGFAQYAGIAMARGSATIWARVKGRWREKPSECTRGLPP